MKKFIYVNTPEAKEVLIKANYVLLKSDERNGIYVFRNTSEPDSTQSFALDNIQCLQSDVLTF